jgi:hypothetical protein
MDLALESIARQVAAAAMADLRTVRRELQQPGAVRGFVGERIRSALARHRAPSATPRPAA